MSQTTPPSLAVRKLPVGATFAEAYSLVFGRLGLLVKAAAFPYLISTVLAVLSFMAQSNWALTALVVSVISIAFRTCTGWVPAAGGAPVARGEEDA